MGWYSDQGELAMMRCKKHPRHRQSAGVCSLCLADRLSELAAENNAKVNSHQAAPYFSSSDASISNSTMISTPSSPTGVDKSFFFSGPLISNRAPIFRSRSVAVAVERPAPRKERQRRSGTGFWSKLLRVGGKRRKEEVPTFKAAKPPFAAASVAVRN